MRLLLANKSGGIRKMKKHILSAAASLAASCALAVTASAAFVTPTGNPTTYVLNTPDAVYEDGDAWIHVINPNNSAKMFDAGSVDPGTQDVIICFDISNCDGSYKAFAGFGINSWTPSIWDEKAYMDTIGGVPDFVIDHDGSYEMIIPFNLFMKATPINDPETGEEIFKEELETVDCLEICIRDVPEDTTTTITVTDVKLSSVAHAIDGSPIEGSDEPDDGSDDSNEDTDNSFGGYDDDEGFDASNDGSSDNPDDSAGTTTTEAPAPSSGNDSPLIIIGIIIAAAVIIAVIIIVIVAKKKKN